MSPNKKTVLINLIWELAVLIPIIKCFGEDMNILRFMIILFVIFIILIPLIFCSDE